MIKIKKSKKKSQETKRKKGKQMKPCSLNVVKSVLTNNVYFSFNNKRLRIFLVCFFFKNNEEYSKSETILQLA